MKKINQVLNIIMGAFVGVFVGHGAYVAWNYNTHPEVYAIQSAPWYTSILVECLDVTSGAITSGTTAKISTEVVNAHGTPEMDIGDNVRVVFTGANEDTPVSFNTIFSIFLLDENGEVIPFDVSSPPAPSVTGVVTEVYEHSFRMLGEPTEGYSNAEEYSL